LITAVVLSLLASANFELGGSGGIGRLMGEPEVAEGRDAAVVDPLRSLWSASGWAGYQWMRGHFLALRYDYSIASGRIGNQRDLGEDLEETLVLQVYGLEYVRNLPHERFRVRWGGGLGYAMAEDVLETDAQSVSSKGTGVATWFRCGIEVPVVAELRWHLDGVGQWTSFAAMKTEGLEPYETAFPVLRLETGFSFGL
jgi:hypothetical protein